MKKILLSFFVVCLCLQEAGAQYHPMLGDSSTKWCLAWNLTPVRMAERAFDYNTIVSEGDTLIGLVTYQKVHFEGAAYAGAWREDSLLKHVYFVNAGDSVEQLLYDFSLNMGDSILVDLENNFNGYMNDGYYYVDSVATVNIRSGARKYLRLHNPANTIGMGGKPLKLEWIESVGDLHNPAYTLMPDNFGGSQITFYCGGDIHETIVINNEIDLTRNYVNTCAIEYVSGDVDADTCGIAYWGNVNELMDLSNALHVYPNPSTGKDLNIEMEQLFSGELYVNLTDLQGKNIFTSNVQVNSNLIQLNNLQLESGMYVLTVCSGNTVIGRGKVLVE